MIDPSSPRMRSFDLDRVLTSAARHREEELGHWLVATGRLSSEALADYRRLANQPETEPPHVLEDLLLERGIIDEIDLHCALATDALHTRTGHRYDVHERIGEGSAGAVHRCTDLELKREVALKILKPGHGSAEETVRRFLREAEIMARICHPNVLVVHDVGALRGRPFLVTELVKGSTLREAMDAHPPPSELIAAIAAAARGVGAAHQQGIVHRDLKPGNILIGADGVPKVADFGLARLLGDSGDLTATNARIGTPRYMAPEQCCPSLAGISPRTDVYALGAILHHAITGAPPFDDGTARDPLVRATHEPDSVLARAPRTPRDLAVICDVALSLDPRRRYAHADELAEDLERFLARRPILARPPSLAYRLRKLVDRRRTAVSAAGVVAMLGVALAVSLAARGEARAAQESLERRDEARERVIAQTRANLMARLRETARLSLRAALELRRHGDLRAMHEFADDVEAAARAAIALHPDLGEPHHLLGCMYRAQMRIDAALQEQDLALRKSPGHPGALRERGLLAVARVVARRAELGVASRRHERWHGVREWIHLRRRRPETSDDPEVQAWQTRARADLTRVSGPLPESLRQWLDGDASGAYRTLLATAGERDALTPREQGEVYGWLGTFAIDARRRQDAIAWFSKAHALDRGYLPHLLGRVRARGSRLFCAARSGEGPDRAYAALVADLSEAHRLAPERGELLVERGLVHLYRANLRGLAEDASDAAFALALADVSAAIAGAPQVSERWYCRALIQVRQALIHARRGTDPTPALEAAMPDIEEAYRREPDRYAASRGFMSQVALRYALRFDHAPAAHDRRARESFERLLVLDPTDVASWKSLGVCHHLMGRREPARVHLEIAAALANGGDVIVEALLRRNRGR